MAHTLLISDLHLAAERPHINQQFFTFIRDTAPAAVALYILGDLFEYWIGDDDTDEDAFASGGPERLLSIRVGTKRPSIAQYRLKSQSDIDHLMKLLVDLRRTKPAARS